MARNDEKVRGKLRVVSGDAKESLEDKVDSLFKLPLSEFTTARNSLANQLKKNGRTNEASLVKALAKPSVTAWAVNQLHWYHREHFENLAAAGRRLQQLQKSGFAGKVAVMREALNARREALSQLSELATTLLHNAGHNPTPDTLHRITTNLEAISSSSSIPDGPTAGRLSHDVDPPGFESFATSIPATRLTKTSREPSCTQKSGGAAKPKQKGSASVDVKAARELEESRRLRIATAKTSLQDAKRLLAEMRARLQRLGAVHKNVQTETKNAEKQKREAEERLRKISAVAAEVDKRARRIADELSETTKAFDEATRAVAKGSRELESLFRESRR